MTRKSFFFPFGKFFGPGAGIVVRIYFFVAEFSEDLSKFIRFLIIKISNTKIFHPPFIENSQVAPDLMQLIQIPDPSDRNPKPVASIANVRAD